MKREWSSWISIAANVGLIVGLVLVAMQLRQNADLTRVQIFSQNISDERAVEIGMFGDHGAVAWAKSIEEPAIMTSAEIKIMDGWLVNQVLGWSRSALLESEGLVAPGTTEAHVRATSAYFGNRFARTWWKYESQRGYDSEFVSLVDSVLHDVDENENQRWLNALKAEAAAREDESTFRR
jgi:hypothetical protein